MSYAEQKYSNNSTIGTSGYKPLDQIVNQDKASIEALINQWFSKGFVKSVQRGYVTVESGSRHTINIKSVNVNKSIVLIHGDIISDQYISSSKIKISSSCAIESFTSTSFKLNFNLIVIHSSDISWQVIEFY